MNAITKTQHDVALLSRSTAAFGEYAFGGAGRFVSEGSTVADRMKEANLTWQVVKRPLAFRTKTGSTKSVPAKYALVRDDNEGFLSLCGKVYKPAQNEQTLGFMDRFARAAGMTTAAVGSLDGGRYVWTMLNVGDSFTLPGKDKVGGYLLLVSPHVAGRSLVIRHLATRLACWNQVPAQLKQDKGALFRMPHTLEWDENVELAAETAMGLSQKILRDFKVKAERLTEILCTPEQADDYFQRVMKLGAYAPSQTMDAVIAATETGVAMDAVLAATAENSPTLARAEKTERTSPVLVKMREALTGSPGAALPSAKGTAWGAFNAVTYVLDHEVCNSVDRRLWSNWVGGREKQKAEALDLALRLAA